MHVVEPQFFTCTLFFTLFVSSKQVLSMPTVPLWPRNKCGNPMSSWPHWPWEKPIGIAMTSHPIGSKMIGENTYRGLMGTVLVGCTTWCKTGRTTCSNWNQHCLKPALQSNIWMGNVWKWNATCYLFQFKWRKGLRPWLCTNPPRCSHYPDVNQNHGTLKILKFKTCFKQIVKITIWKDFLCLISSEMPMWGRKANAKLAFSEVN